MLRLDLDLSLLRNQSWDADGPVRCESPMTSREDVRSPLRGHPSGQPTDEGKLGLGGRDVYILR